MIMIVFSHAKVIAFDLKNTLPFFPMKINLKIQTFMGKRGFWMMHHVALLTFDLRRSLYPHCFCPFMSRANDRCPVAQQNRICPVAAHHITLEWEDDVPCYRHAPFMKVTSRA